MIISIKKARKEALVRLSGPDEPINRVILTMDSNDFRGYLPRLQKKKKTFPFLGHTMKLPTWKTTNHTCCDDNGYSMPGDYIFDSHPEGKCGIPPLPRGWTKDDQLMSDHLPVFYVTKIDSRDDGADKSLTHIKKFCSSPTKNYWEKISPNVREIFTETARWCIRKNKGDVGIANKIVSLTTKKEYSTIPLSSPFKLVVTTFNSLLSSELCGYDYESDLSEYGCKEKYLHEWTKDGGRGPRIINQLSKRDSDIIVLNEVCSAQARYIAEKLDMQLVVGGWGVLKCAVLWSTKGPRALEAVQQPYVHPNMRLLQQKLQLVKGGQTISVTAVHLKSGESPNSEERRLKQITDYVLPSVANVSADIYLLAGDMNTTRELRTSYDPKVLDKLELEGWRNVSGTAATYYGWTRLKFDYVFFKDGSDLIRNSKSEVIVDDLTMCGPNATQGSDHTPVTVIMDFIPKKQHGDDYDATMTVLDIHNKPVKFHLTSKKHGTSSSDLRYPVFISETPCQMTYRQPPNFTPTLLMSASDWKYVKRPETTHQGAFGSDYGQVNLGAPNYRWVEGYFPKEMTWIAVWKFPNDLAKVRGYIPSKTVAFPVGTYSMLIDSWYKAMLYDETNANVIKFSFTGPPNTAAQKIPIGSAMTKYRQGGLHWLSLDGSPNRKLACISTQFFMKEFWPPVPEDTLRSLYDMIYQLAQYANISAFPCWEQHHVIVFYSDLLDDTLITPLRLAKILKDTTGRGGVVRRILKSHALSKSAIEQWANKIVSLTTKKEWDYITLPKGYRVFRGSKDKVHLENRSTYFTRSVITANTYVPTNKKGYITVYELNKSIKLFKLDSLYNANRLLEDALTSKISVTTKKSSILLYDVIRKIYKRHPKEKADGPLTKLLRQSIIANDLIFSNWLCEQGFAGYHADTTCQSWDGTITFPSEIMLCEPKNDVTKIEEIHRRRTKSAKALRVLQQKYNPAFPWEKICVEHSRFRPK